jgi:RNA polymerase sigma factor (sigma-70 family)
MAALSPRSVEADLLVRRCRQGDPAALAELRELCQPSLENILVARGATVTETQDLLADLWADCVPGDDDRPSLLEKFSGRCTPQGWLATVLTNRWVDLKRRQQRRGESAAPAEGEEASTTLERLPSEGSALKEEVLVGILRDSLEAAFGKSPPEALVMLRLLHQHGLTQREICRMMGWTESKVSRFLSSAMEHIQNETVNRVKQSDPWLQLTWDDFLSVCETYELNLAGR